MPSWCQARSDSVQKVIAEIASSVGAPLVWVPPAGQSHDSNHPLAQSLEVSGFPHLLQVQALGFGEAALGTVRMSMKKFQVMYSDKHRLRFNFSTSTRLEQIKLQVPLLGDYQRSNVALALVLLLELRSSKSLS